KDILANVPGVENPGVFRIQGQAKLDLPIDRQKCARWNVSAADVQAAVQSAVGGKASTQILEGEKVFDLTVRWPLRLRADEQAILEIPIPVTNNQVTPGNQASVNQTPVSGGSQGLSSTGTQAPLPVPTGSAIDVPQIANGIPVRRLRDFVTPRNAKGLPDENGSFMRPGASTIYREQGQRLIALKFEVRGRDPASTVAEARAKVSPLVEAPYRSEWSGEFQEMADAIKRLARVFAVSLILIAVLLYLAFHSIRDALVVFANVLAMAVGGVIALKITGLNFNISAAVGFISILGVAVMNGLLFVSAFNRLRARGLEL